MDSVFKAVVVILRTNQMVGFFNLLIELRVFLDFWLVSTWMKYLWILMAVYYKIKIRVL